MFDWRILGCLAGKDKRRTEKRFAPDSLSYPRYPAINYLIKNGFDRPNQILIMTKCLTSRFQHKIHWDFLLKRNMGQQIFSSEARWLSVKDSCDKNNSL